jgi:hypothetical protein
LVRGRKCRGGTPSGERAAISASRARMARTIGRHAPGGVLLPFILCSLDEAQRNPGAAFKLIDRPRITLRSIRATDAEQDRAKNRSHRRFRREAMVLRGMFDALYGMPRAHIAPREGNFFASLRAKRSNPAPRYVLWIASSRSPSSGRPGVPIARARWGARIAGRTCWLLAMTVGNRVATGPIAVLSRAACPSAQPSPRSAWRGAGLTE